jgi:hypothetical protein
MLHFSNVSMFLYEFWKFILFSGNIKKTKLHKDYSGHRADSGPRPLPLRRVAGHKVTVGRTGWLSPVVKPTEPSHAPGVERARSRTGCRARGALSGTDISGEPGV